MRISFFNRGNSGLQIVQEIISAGKSTSVTNATCPQAAATRRSNWTDRAETDWLNGQYLDGAAVRFYGNTVAIVWASAATAIKALIAAAETMEMTSRKM